MVHVTPNESAQNNGTVTTSGHFNRLKERLQKSPSFTGNVLDEIRANPF